MGRLFRWNWVWQCLGVCLIKARPSLDDAGLVLPRSLGFQLLGERWFRRWCSRRSGHRFAGPGLLFWRREELLDDDTAVFFVVLKRAIAESQPGSVIQRGLIETCRLTTLLQQLGGQQCIFQTHAAAYGDVDVENRRPVALSCRLATQAQLQRQAS